MKIFVDSDVVISSLISQKGAAYLLINKADLDLFVSNHSQEELETVVDRLDIKKDKLNLLLKRKFKKVKIAAKLEVLKEQFKDYTLDVNDCHIVAAAKKAKAKFLITYNTKHFKEEKIRQDFSIMVTTPAKLLQYLRSIS